MVGAGRSLPNWKTKQKQNKKESHRWERELEYASDGGLEEETVCPLLAVGGVGWEGFCYIVENV